MRILAYDPLVTSDYMMAHGAEPVSLQALLHTSDFVSLHCPLTTATEGLMSADAFAMMQPHAYFITTARGSIHDETALVAALRDGKIAGAGLDVWSKEPPAPNHPLLGFDNVIVSSHTAGVTHEARQNIATVAAEQIIDLFDGVRAPRILNPEVWDVFSERLERMFG
jgi:D-3-phosphoglycerate dehydrogenase